MDDLDRKKLLVIGGPTASGKSALGVRMAQCFDGEVISADSMQIYKSLNVGTAKITANEMANVPHHLIDLVDPSVEYSVADYISCAAQTIDDIHKRNKLPMVVGGTGLYISSLIEGIQFDKQIEKNTDIRNRLEDEWSNNGAGALYSRLQKIDPKAAEKIHPNNKIRVIRALEVIEESGRLFSEMKEHALPAQKPYDALILCIGFRNRELLYERINFRIDQMLKSGLIEEAEQVFVHRREWKTAANAIGYKELFPYFDGTDTLQHCVEILKQSTRRYAKRQITWFSHMSDVHWLFFEDGQTEAAASMLIDEFLVKQTVL